jgi:hypothetical protein
MYLAKYSGALEPEPLEAASDQDNAGYVGVNTTSASVVFSAYLIQESAREAIERKPGINGYYFVWGLYLL